MRRQARLFALAEHLRARRTGVTAAELAERFGVTLRTIYRDLDALREAVLVVTVIILGLVHRQPHARTLAVSLAASAAAGP